MLQRVEVSPEVDVVRLAINYQRGHGFDAAFLGFTQARFVFTQVHDFHIKPVRVERDRDILFGGDTHRASGMIEGSFRFHFCVRYAFDVLRHIAMAIVAR
jgi:hypothetical protein